MKFHLIIISILTAALAVKFYFISHPNRFLFGLSFTDITKLSSSLESKPLPLPYVETYVEYPVVIGLFIWVVRGLSPSREGYLFLSAFLLSILAYVSFFISGKISEKAGSGRRFYLFWLFSPALFLFTFYNWDILAVFFLLLAIYYYLDERDFLATLVLTLGVWTKLFPIFLLPPVILKNLFRKRYRQLFLIVGTFLIFSLALNLPIYLRSPSGWVAFFNFSKERGPNIDSLWAGLFVLSDKIFGTDFRFKNDYTNFINYASNLSLIFFSGLLLAGAWRKRFFDLPALTAILICFFLLTAKVYSPPYNLWLLPLLALTPIGLRGFLAFDLSNVLVFFTIFQYFYETNILGRSQLGFPWYRLAYVFVLLRHLSLIYLTQKLWRRRDEDSE